MKTARLRPLQFALYTAVAAVMSVLTASASDSRPVRTVSVSGSCTRSIVPDRGSIRVTAEAQDKELRSATRDAAKQYEAVRDAVKRLNLADAELTTTEYSVNEIREWEKDRQVSKGFRARMGLEVATSDIQKLGEVIAIASREGIRDVGALVSFVSRAKMRDEQAACLQAAARDAQSRAEKLAEALGAKLGEAIQIVEGGGGETEPRPRPMMMARAMSVPDAEPAPGVESGKREITVTVSATFGLK